MNYLKNFMQNDYKKRWLIIPVSTLMFICLGTIYSWSVFRKPLEDLLNIGSTQSGLPYMLFLAFYAALMPITGLFIEKYKPSTIIFLGGVLVGCGWLLAGFSSSITTISITYGVIAGSGVGILYGVPVAIVSKWFYDKKGLAVGLILAGFGLSPLVSAPIARSLIENYGLLSTFKIIGIAFLLILLPLSFLYKFPSNEFIKNIDLTSSKSKNTLEIPTKEMVKDKRFYVLWICFGLGTLMGLMSVGMTSAVGVEIAKLPTSTVAPLLSIFAIFNGLGRPLFGWITDRFSPLIASLISYSMIIIACLLIIVPSRVNTLLFAIAFSMIWMTLGSWLAIAPTATGIFFGQKYHSRNFGIVFTAYGFGAVLGVLMSGFFKDNYGSYIYSFYAMILIATLGIIISLIFLKPNK